MTQTPPPYADRIARVRLHIAENLNGDLSLDRLADVAALSRFHFHRVFAAMTGETVAEAVRRARLNRAAVLVVVSREGLPRVARACGYPNPQSFSRAFAQAYGATPTALRRKGRLPPALIPPEKGVLPMHPVRIDTRSPTRLAALPHRGAYPEIGRTFGALGERIAATGLGPRIGGPMVAVYHDSPDAVPVADLRAHAGMPVQDQDPLPEGFDDLVLPGGRMAVLTMTGPYSGLAAAWAWLYGQWLPASGEEPGDAAPFEAYPNNPMTAAPADLVTEICVPLR